MQLENIFFWPFVIVWVSNINFMNSLCHWSTYKYLLLAKVVIDVDFITVLYYKSRRDLQAPLAMQLEKFFLPFCHCIDQRNGKKLQEQDIFNFWYIWDSLIGTVVISWKNIGTFIQLPIFFREISFFKSAVIIWTKWLKNTQILEQFSKIQGIHWLFGELIGDLKKAQNFKSSENVYMSSKARLCIDKLCDESSSFSLFIVFIVHTFSSFSMFIYSSAWMIKMSLQPAN